ncbi:MAG: glycosyltransferase family 39 protein [Gemmatimonadaceae bacterium]
MQTNATEPNRAQLSSRYDAVDVGFRAGFAFLLALAIAAGVASLTWPLSWDEGIFAWIGSTLLKGGTPYVDAWDVKGPVTYFVYALAEELFGHTAFAVRLFDLLISVTGTIAVFLLVSRYTNKRTALYAAPLFFLSLIGQGYNVLGQPDLWVGWCMVFSVWVTTETPTAKSVALACTFVGVAILIKPIYAALVVVPLIPALFAGSPSPSTQLRMLWAAAAGCLAPIALCVAWYWQRHAAGEFLDAYIRANLENSGAGRGGLLHAGSSILEFLLNRRAVLIAIPAIAIGLISSTGVVRWRNWMLGSWIATVISLIVLQDRWFTYHWAPLYPPLALAASIGFFRVWHADKSGAERFIRPLFVALFAVLTLGASVVPLKSVAASARLLTRRITVEQFDASFTDYPGIMTAADVRNATAYVAAHTKRTDKVFVWDDPQVNFLSQRETVSRFAIWAPLLPLRGELTARHKRNREEFFTALQLKPPTLVLIERSAWRNSPLVTVHYLPAKFPELANWIDAHYVAADTVGNFFVFRRP